MSELRQQVPLAPLPVPAAGAGQASAKSRGASTAAAWTRRYLRKVRIWDTAAIAAAVSAGDGAAGGLLAGGSYLPAPGWLVAAVVAAAWLTALSVFRTRDLRVIGVGPGEYKRVVSGTAAAFGLLAAVFLLTEADGVRMHFLVTLPLGAVLLLGGRWGLRRWLTSRRHHGHYLSRVLVLGSREDVEYVVGQIDKKSGAAYLVVGAALEEPEDAGAATVGRTGIPVIGGLDGVVAAAASLEADAAIVAGQLRRGSGYLRELGWSLEATATELVVALSLTNVAGPRIQMRPVEGLPLMHVDLPQFPGFRHLLKRAVDIAAPSLALVLLAPLFAVLAVMIRRDSPGGAIFRQERVCRDGRTFQMYKFRSMVRTAEEELEKLRE
ncbi:sugar transferase, partial [Arthrobacter deserti]|nr:sugar transferase [Arthrobacter deserti]